MKSPTPVLPEGPLTFADYFKLNLEIGDILAVFGYSYRLESCVLPRGLVEEGDLGEVKQLLERILPHISLTNESARREFMIAPVIAQAALLADARVNVEFPLEIDEKLRGTLDYLIRSKHELLIVEAKSGDLKRGFTQLAIELVALERWIEDPSDSPLYGAVSMGDVWKFGFLDRATKRIAEDLNTYSVPTDLEEVVAILAGILTE